LLEVGDAEAALRASAALARFWDVRGYAVEGGQWLLDALASRSDQPRALRAKALLRVAVLAIRRGESRQVRPLLEESLELGDPGGDSEGLALLLLGHVAADEGDFAGSLPLFERAAAAYRSLGDRRGVAVALNDLGVSRFMLGEYEAAATDCDEAVALSAEVGDRQATATHLVAASLPLLELGREAEAVARIEESVQIAQELGFKQTIANALTTLAAVAVRRNELERGARVLGAAEALLESIEGGWDVADRANHARVVAALGEALEHGTLAAARAYGRTLDVGQALAEGLQRT
jgi:non-specific serine/threonine protein kinase